MERMRRVISAVVVGAARCLATDSKPPLSQKVRFIDRVRVEARGGDGGGGSSALFGRSGAASPAAMSGTAQSHPHLHTLQLRSSLMHAQSLQSTLVAGTVRCTQASTHGRPAATAARAETCFSEPTLLAPASRVFPSCCAAGAAPLAASSGVMAQQVRRTLAACTACTLLRQAGLR
jgi:hypothetical protein